ncbi:hypothetical protein EMIHUDRAFT_244681 [Emiliania huxleyi CCMP1516]|uniref:Glycosyltransferase 61 catalytic domain-containing protein n=2 Tax=Emiliania huxleyi TaxID=2903 RepID=A0A0D3J094_EMIH1|nr:hypothetical protein EMIHUDRAFT_244681 [Emiliania huxleyi CCMP1516]EOD16929.1 hypothetical protein EMIHUDRAFT_244681 [Emiliania huxleyi CCMP1516]|eukprot:XP_005769358.1 hypothetical protein EMIHUDRAFT_244681 [Emiliania huxleyi CCMP1516]
MSYAKVEVVEMERAIDRAVELERAVDDAKRAPVRDRRPELGRRCVVFRRLVLAALLATGAAAYVVVAKILECNWNPLQWSSSSQRFEMCLAVWDNHAHFVRDILWRSFRRDWPAPARLEPWMATFHGAGPLLSALEAAGAAHELVQPPSPLFEWKTLVGDGVVTVCPPSPEFSFYSMLASTQLSAPDLDVYLSRGHNTRRRFTNEGAMLDALRDAFPALVVADTSVPLLEQARFFTRARVLIGLHGAGLANAVWMSPSHLHYLVEIMPGNYSKVTYGNLAGCLGLGYERINTPTSLVRASNPRDIERRRERDAIVEVSPADLAMATNVSRKIVAARESFERLRF